jgi:hypothetical protein
MKAKNLDVRGTSQDAENTSVKDVQRNRSGLAHFNSLVAPRTQPHQCQTGTRRRYRTRQQVHH